MLFSVVGFIKKKHQCIATLALLECIERNFGPGRGLNSSMVASDVSFYMLVTFSTVVNLCNSLHLVYQRWSLELNDEDVGAHKAKF